MGRRKCRICSRRGRPVLAPACPVLRAVVTPAAPAAIKTNFAQRLARGSLRGRSTCRGVRRGCRRRGLGWRRSHGCIRCRGLRCHRGCDGGGLSGHGLLGGYSRGRRGRGSLRSALLCQSAGRQTHNKKDRGGERRKTGHGKSG